METKIEPLELTDADFETKPQPQTKTPLTLDEWKRQAREREEEREAKEMERQANYLSEITRRNNSLTDMLKETPVFAMLFAAADKTVCKDNNAAAKEVVVSFHLPLHAELQARFEWQSNSSNKPGYWEHVGFRSNKGYEYAYWVSDPEKMWRVSEWTGTRYDQEEDTYYPAYQTVDFKDLGDALLHAERVWRDPADIQREVDDHVRAGMSVLCKDDLHIECLDKDNCTCICHKNIAHTRVAPEPTAAETLLGALQRYIYQQIQIAHDL